MSPATHHTLVVYGVYRDGCIQRLETVPIEIMGWDDKLFELGGEAQTYCFEGTFESQLAGWRHEVMVSRRKPGS